MICKNCNNQIPNNSATCPYCSAPVGVNQESLNTSICSFCGAALNRGDAFCVNCGNRVESTEFVERYPMKPEVEERKKKKGNGVLIALIIVLSVVIIGLAAFIIIQNYISAEESNAPQAPNEQEVNTIELQVDSYDSEVTSDYYTIYGTASATEIDSVLTVDGEKVATVIAGKGTFRWSKEVYLYEGSNTFTVELSDSEGVSKTEKITIYKLIEGDSFLFESDRYYITDYDLYGKTQHEVALIRNEIYARHGYIFSTPEYAEYFSQKSWYTPNPNFSEALLNDIEKANKDFLVQYEIDRGWR